MEACPFSKAGSGPRAPGAQTWVSGEARVLTAKVCGWLCQGRGTGSFLPPWTSDGDGGRLEAVGLFLLGAWPWNTTCPGARASLMSEGGQQPARTLQGLERKCKGGCPGLLEWLLPLSGNQALPSGSIKSWGGEAVGHLEGDLGPGNWWGWQVRLSGGGFDLRLCSQ